MPPLLVTGGEDWEVTTSGGGIGRRAEDPREKSCNFAVRADIDLWSALFEPDMSLLASL